MVLPLGGVSEEALVQLVLVSIGQGARVSFYGGVFLSLVLRGFDDLGREAAVHYLISGAFHVGKAELLC